MLQLKVEMQVEVDESDVGDAVAFEMWLSDLLRDNRIQVNKLTVHED